MPGRTPALLALLVARSVGERLALRLGQAIIIEPVARWAKVMRDAGIKAE